MHTSQNTAARHWCDLDALPFAAGAILLGLITLVFQDFALQWQPVPQGVPGRGPLAIASGLVLIAGGALILCANCGRYRLVLPLFYAMWVIVLHLPNTWSNPNLGSLLGVAEIASLALAGLVAMHWSRMRSVSLTLRILYGLCPIVFGVCHFVYVDITASMVPAWLPSPRFWAYFTGSAHIAAGCAIITGVLGRLAATLLAMMCGGFVLLLHVPRVAAAPLDRMEWTMLAVALSIAGGAWLMRSLFAPRSSGERSPSHG